MTLGAVVLWLFACLGAFCLGVAAFPLLARWLREWRQRRMVARGETLDRMMAVLGLWRLSGESDKAFRERGRSFLRNRYKPTRERPVWVTEEEWARHLRNDEDRIQNPRQR